MVTTTNGGESLVVCDDSPKKDRKKTYEPFSIKTNQTLVKGKVTQDHIYLSQRLLVRKKRWKLKIESLVTCVPKHLQEIKVCLNTS